MSTYAQLKENALIIANQEGDSTAGKIAEIALVEALKYTRSHVLLDGLIGEAEYTWLAADEDIALGVDGFEITESPVEPIELYVGAAGESGTVYVYRRYLDWRRLNALPGKSRGSMFEESIRDERPARCFSINADGDVVLVPKPSTGQVVTLYYHKEPAGYSAASSPEIPSKWEFILISGAVLWLKEYEKDPDMIIDPVELFGKLDPQISRMDRALRGPRSRQRMKMAPSHRV
jgi:hypothetical protein